MVLSSSILETTLAMGMMGGMYIPRTGKWVRNLGGLVPACKSTNSLVILMTSSDTPLMTGSHSLTHSPVHNVLLAISREFH